MLYDLRKSGNFTAFPLRTPYFPTKNRPHVVKFGKNKKIYNNLKKMLYENRKIKKITT